MSDVVLRCPNCGTTQSTAGDCETCHEARVRWYCPNHSPGRWLDGPACAECAERPKPRREPPRPTTPTRNASRGAPPPEPTRDPARELLEELLGRRERRPERDYSDEVETPTGWRIEPPVAPRAEVPPPWRRERPPAIGLPRIPFLGCVGQLVKLAIIIFVLIALATCWFFGGVPIVIGDLGQQRDAGVASRTALESGARQDEREGAPLAYHALHGHVATHRT